MSQCSAVLYSTVLHRTLQYLTLSYSTLLHLPSPPFILHYFLVHLPTPNPEGSPLRQFVSIWLSCHRTLIMRLVISMPRKQPPQTVWLCNIPWMVQRKGEITIKVQHQVDKVKCCAWALTSQHGLDFTSQKTSIALERFGNIVGPLQIIYIVEYIIDKKTSIWEFTNIEVWGDSHIWSAILIRARRRCYTF